MMTFIAYAVIIVGILTLVQLVRVMEITGKLKGNNQDSVTDATNRRQGNYWLLFLVGYFAFFIWLVVAYGEYLLPEAASEHGATIDTVLNFNFLIITIAFVITHILLFYFASKYAGKKGRVATFVTHNNKLELLWTSVPAVVLAVIIIYGLSAWNDITDTPPENAINIELYSKQFGWTARYAGTDNQLGKANYLFISGTNPLGLITETTIKERIVALKEDIAYLEGELEDAPKGGLKEEELNDDLNWKNRQLRKVYRYQKQQEQEGFTEGLDDKLAAAGEFHIPVGQPVSFQFRSQDVIHSAYMPHFRAQMNTVPGAVTRFHFTPTITTEEMRRKTGNPEFHYILLCNKICGAAHYNMQMNIIVESEEDYKKWLAEQKPFGNVLTAETSINTEVTQK